MFSLHGSKPNSTHPTAICRILLEAPVTVTPIAVTADATSKANDERETGLPVVFVARGRRRRESWEKSIDGVLYRGSRHELTFPLDMSINFNDDSDDVELCDAVCAAIEDHEVELWDLGLTEIEISGDEAAQNAGIGRNPYLVTCAVYSLANYSTPEPEVAP